MMLPMWAQIVVGALAVAMAGYMVAGLYVASRVWRKMKGAPKRVGRGETIRGLILAWILWLYYLGYESGFSDGYGRGHSMGSKDRPRRLGALR